VNQGKYKRNESHSLVNRTNPNKITSDNPGRDIDDSTSWRQVENIIANLMNKFGVDDEFRLGAYIIFLDGASGMPKICK
jgi:hypothetical protein